MLLLQFAQYSSFFLGTPKSDIPGAALELCQLKTKQFSPEILKLSTKHKDNPFTLNCFLVHCTFLFIFHAGSREIFGSQVIKKKPAGSACVSRLSFCLLWLWLHSTKVPSKSSANFLSKWIYYNLEVLEFGQIHCK